MTKKYYYVWSGEDYNRNVMLIYADNMKQATTFALRHMIPKIRLIQAGSSIIVNEYTLAGEGVRADITQITLHTINHPDKRLSIRPNQRIFEI